MTDYRIIENRRNYFGSLYRLNLEHGIMPGLVYLYMPELARRNGMLFLLGQDHLVWDKRQPNSHDGNYPEFKKMCRWLNGQAEDYLAMFTALNPELPGVSKFTLESNLCTFKNHFFGRRYPGVYADMALERILWADERGQQQFTEVFKDMRSELLPTWLRAECESEPLSIKSKAAMFPDTGFPYRGEHFL